MTSNPLGRQVDFKIETEDWGKVLLTDGSTVETRIVLADLLIMNEDVFGPQIATNQVVAFRVKTSPELIKTFKEKPLVPMELPPLTPEEGYEKIEVDKVVNPTQSTYTFEKSRLILSLDVDSVARNNKYRVLTGAPVYNLRWTINAKVTKV